MKKQTIQGVSILVFPLLFNAIFWEEQFGINLLIFTTLAVLVLAVFLFPESMQKRTVQLSVLLTIVSGLMVIVHHSIISQLLHLGSFFLLVGFLHEGSLKTVVGAGIQFAVNLFTTFIGAFKYLKKAIEPLFGGNQIAKKIARNMVLAIIPMLVFLVFFLIFYNANPVFSDLVNNLSQYLSNFFSFTFDELLIGRINFFIVGTYLSFSILFEWGFASKLPRLDFSNEYISPSNESSENAANYQRNEYKIALMLIVSVNALLLIINIIDINFLWLSFDYSEAGNLAKLVHEGTGTLILSIVISIAILLYYFRQDLNFYEGNTKLKYAAYAWIIQNFILVISVSFRNYYYINFYGLTHLRIGVAVFLILTTIGLLTLWIKIKNLRSFFYMFRANTWAWYIVLISLTLINWDVIIARFNLAHTFRANTDFNYLLSLSDKTLPILQENRERLSSDDYRNQLDKRIEHYLKRQQRYTWVSWNWADAEAVKALEVSQTNK